MAGKRAGVEKWIARWNWDSRFFIPSLFPVHLVNVSAGNRRVRYTNKLSQRKFMFVCAAARVESFVLIPCMHIQVERHHFETFSIVNSYRWQCVAFMSTFSVISMLQWVALRQLDCWNLTNLVHASYVDDSQVKNLLFLVPLKWSSSRDAFKFEDELRHVDISLTVLGSNLFRWSAVSQFQELPSINPSGCRFRVSRYPWLEKPPSNEIILRAFEVHREMYRIFWTFHDVTFIKGFNHHSSCFHRCSIERKFWKFEKHSSGLHSINGFFVEWAAFMKAWWFELKCTCYSNRILNLNNFLSNSNFRSGGFSSSMLILEIAKIITSFWEFY